MWFIGSSFRGGRTSAQLTLYSRLSRWTALTTTRFESESLVPRNRLSGYMIPQSQDVLRSLEGFNICTKPASGKRVSSSWKCPSLDKGRQESHAFVCICWLKYLLASLTVSRRKPRIRNEAQYLGQNGLVRLLISSSSMDESEKVEDVGGSDSSKPNLSLQATDLDLALSSEGGRCIAG